jgi:hypothetical protein
MWKSLDFFYVLARIRQPLTSTGRPWTPLRLALHGGHVEVARLLGEHGADTADMDEQVAPSCQLELHEDLELARMFAA